MIRRYFNWVVARAARPPPLRKGAILLPCNKEPLAKAYLYSAYPLSLLTAQGFPEILLSHYTQIHFPADKVAGNDDAKFEFFPPLGIRQYIELGYFSASTWNWRKTYGDDRKAIIARIVDALAQGRYVRVFANEFFIPGSSRHLLRELRHEHLIVGYDSAEAVFIGVGFLASGAYGWTRIPVLMMAEGICSNGGRRIGSYNDNDDLLELQTMPTEGLRVDGETLRNQIGAYFRGDDETVSQIRRLRRLSSKNGPSDLAQWSCAGNRGFFGAKVYPVFKDWLRQSASERKEIDLRATLTLLEHKVALRDCLARLCSRDPDGRKLVGEFAPAVTAARALHVSAFSANRTPRRKRGSLAGSMIKLVDDIQRVEEGVLRKVVEDPGALKPRTFTVQTAKL